jgi:small-conductance mechanosensitive channel/CRP-like cAMP-binding protein
MPSSLIKRLAIPFALFATCATLALFSEDFLRQFGAEAASQTRRVASYTLQIGIWLTSAFLLNRLLAVFLWDMAVARTLGAPVPRLLKDVVGAIIYLIGITGILAFVFKQSVTGIWATSGVVGIVLGFALQSLILDVFTGLAINVDRPYRIGDWIMLHGRQKDLHIVGNVMEMNWRTTRLRTAHNNMVVVPNSVIGTTVITNFMQPQPRSRLELYFTLDFGVPSERAVRVLTAAVRAVLGGPGGPLEEPKPSIRIKQISELGVEYRVRYWVLPADLSPNKSRHIVITSILNHLQQAGLSLAYPKRDAFHSAMPQRHLDSTSHADRRALLSRVELLEALSAEELDSLTSRIETRRFGEGETLIRRGDAGESMFVLVEGLVYVFADNEGTEIKVAQIVPGQFFGEMSMLTGEARSATVTAASDTVTYEITKEHMSALLTARPVLMEHMSQIVAARKLRNVQALEKATHQEQQEEKTTMARQVMARMKAFFSSA